MAPKAPKRNEDGTVDHGGLEDLYSNPDEQTDPDDLEDEDALELDDADLEDEGDDDTPELVKVHVRGRTILLAPDDAAAIEEMRREQRERDGRIGGENAELRERVARMEGAVQAIGRSTEPEEELQPPDPELARTDFAEYARLNNAYTEAKIARATANLEDRYTTDQETRSKAAETARQQGEYADLFYASYSDFDRPHIKSIVSNVFAENAAEIQGAGNIQAQHERLAELVTDALDEVVGTSSETPTERPPKLAGQRKAAQKPKAKKTEPRSTRDMVHAKRARLRGEGKAA